jgi:hypothetical protein
MTFRLFLMTSWSACPIRCALPRFSYPESTWNTQALREPVETAEPVLREQIVVDTLGRFVYALSTVAKQ